MSRKKIPRTDAAAYARRLMKETGTVTRQEFLAKDCSQTGRTSNRLTLGAVEAKSR